MVGPVVINWPEANFWYYAQRQEWRNAREFSKQEWHPNMLWLIDSLDGRLTTKYILSLAPIAQRDNPRIGETK